MACQRDFTNTSTSPLTSIVSSYTRERLIVDTIDLSTYADANDEINYIFTIVGLFSKFAFCYPVQRKAAENFLKSIKLLYHKECGKRFYTRIVVKSLLRELFLSSQIPLA
ncbi:hypothetical protein CDIK_2869 [Cucumispora dikerogammari]|nr:hypothetical protein CDIK_2869 [Cucumispora dikerogammari]